MERVDIEQEGVREDRLIPFIVFESAQARSERTIKRLVIALIMTIIFLFLSNAFWIKALSEYEYEEVFYEQDGEGLNSINFGTQGYVRNEPKSGYPQTQEEEKGNE